MKKDINWRYIYDDDSYINFPDAELLVKTTLTIRQTRSKYIDTNHNDRSCKEKIVYWAFLNMP